VLGLRAVVTAVVYCGATASTVMGFNVTDAVWPPDVPVTVTVYCVGGNPALANVSDGVAGGVAVAGLTVHGFVVWAGVTEQESATGLLNPLVPLNVMLAVELTPGSTAEGLGSEAWREKSAVCPDAHGNKGSKASPTRITQNLGRNECGNFNMSRVWFK
jgi:hypothetical protein